MVRDTKKSIKWFILYGYLSMILYIVFFAGQRISYSKYASGYLNLIPLKNTLLRFRSLNRLEEKELFNFYENLFVNIILFIPYVLILIFLFKMHNYKKIVWSGIGISVLVETIQYFTGLGVADIDDVFLNTLGILITILAAKIYVTIKKTSLVNPTYHENRSF